MTKIIDNSTGKPKEYTEADGVPLPPSNPVRCMTDLPCLPFNKVVQVAGKPDAGKSTTAGEIAAAAQKAGFEIVIWDAEQKFDAARFKKEFGGDPEKIHVIQTNEIRKGGQLVKDFICVIKEDNPKAKIFVVWDSVGGSISRAETDRNLSDEKHAQPGTEARENSSVIRHWVGMFNKYPDSIAVLLVNQTYAKIGFMQHGDQAKGGSGIEYFSSLIIYLRRVKVLTKVSKKKKIKTGIITRATVAKNHLSQGKTSVHQMDFVITAAGSSVSDLDIPDDEDGNNESEEG
jgi:RecA/RadA recombinase